MLQIITAEQARKLVSKERQEELIRATNILITDQSEQGRKWSHLPTIANEHEKEWLKDLLAENGFTIKEDNPVVNW